MSSVMKIGCPVLRVRNIDKILAFYEKSLGMQVSRRYHIDDGNGGLVCELDVKHRSTLSIYKFRLFRGLSGLKLAQRPMIDMKPILVIKNHGVFKGSSLCIGKAGETKHITEWYYNNEFRKIEMYILTETINFINAYQALKAKIPEIKFLKS